METSGQLLTQSFHLAQVTEGLGPADDLSLRVAHDCRGDAYWYALAVRGDDVAGFPHHRLAGLDAVLQRTVLLAHAGAEHL